MNFASILQSFGLPGVVIACLGWFVMYLMKEHKKERAEWNKTQSKLQDDTNKNIKENTNVLSGLKTLLEHRK